ncbi:hypothetical protein ACXET9_15240 [Brachybacterium sp. DNPG3]
MSEHPSPSAAPAVPVGPASSAADPAVRRATRRGVRYGLSLALVLVGVYEVMTWSPTALMTLIDPLWVAQNLVQLAIGIGLLAVGLAVAPAHPARVGIAAVLAIGAVVLTALLTYLRFRGDLPILPPLLLIIVTPGTAALAAGLLGWLIVRGRHPLTWIGVVAAVLPGILTYVLLVNGAPAAIGWFANLLAFAVIGVGGAWLAVGLSKVLPGR